MVGHESLEDILVRQLVNQGFDDNELAKEVVQSICNHLLNILAVSVSPTELYKIGATTREVVLEILRQQQHILEESSNLEVSFPLSFTPLHKRLDSDIIAELLQRSMENQSVDSPLPMYFRKPYPNWLDISEGYVYEREKIVEKLESNFTKSNVQLLTGTSGSGKSTLSYLLGYSRLTQ
ncbi:unnamed protein product, partial [marine sediment metagenome]